MEFQHSSPAAQVLHELSIDERVRSVWLIGSRANDTATEASDWDLLVFQTQEPTPSAARHPNVDVLCVGPSGRILLEGQTAEYSFLFSTLEWTEISVGVACYRGKNFVDCLDGQAVDAAAPRFHRPYLLAKRLWPRPNKSTPNGNA